MSDDAKSEIEHGEMRAGSAYTSLSDTEIDKLAKELYRNEVFFSFQIHEGERESILGMVFMPLFFLDTITRKQMLENKITTFYAHMEDAGPRSINGYPIFMSCAFLDQNDTNRIIKRHTEIRELLGDIKHE